MGFEGMGHNSQASLPKSDELYQAAKTAAENQPKATTIDQAEKIIADTPTKQENADTKLKK